MASVDKRPDGKWRARWREFPGGPQRTKQFTRKVDADRFLVDVQHRLMTGAYVPPSAGQMTVADYAAEWTARRSATWRPATRDRIERELRIHIIPQLGVRPLASLRRAHLEEWAAGLRRQPRRARPGRPQLLAPSSVEAVFGTLAGMLAAAVDDERIARNPAKDAKLPAVEVAPVVPMTADEVRQLVGHSPEHIRAAVLLAAGTGLRQGEAFGLTVDRVDFLRREMRIDRQLWTPRSGPAVLAPPKSKNSYRAVALSPLVTDALAAHHAAFGPAQDGLLFHFEGRPIVRAMVGKHIRGATARAGLTGRTWHDLRHHHASVLLSEGISAALVAERLGHNVATLLRTYAHVIRKDEDRVRSIVDAALGGGAAEDWLRTAAR